MLTNRPNGSPLRHPIQPTQRLNHGINGLSQGLRCSFLFLHLISSSQFCFKSFQLLNSNLTRQQFWEQGVTQGSEGAGFALILCYLRKQRTCDRREMGQDSIIWPNRLRCNDNFRTNRRVSGAVCQMCECLNVLGCCRREIDELLTLSSPRPQDGKSRATSKSVLHD